MSQDENKVPALPPIWNVPYRRNPFFTGREEVLEKLHDTLTASKKAAITQPQAISGLGGIGKTQTAVEYAYRYGSEYQSVLWAKADSREVLVSDFVGIADLLDLPEKNEPDQNRIVNADKRWLQTHNDWLLILDNVEDLEMVEEFILSAGKGHILLTTRAQATGTLAQGVEIEKMEPEEGALFLLHRAKIIKPDAVLDDASESNGTKAREISKAMDGLPLALDQAGAYIEETKCGLSRYLELYQAQRAELLKRRGMPVFDHPESVTTTFTLSFEKVQQANPAAADLLRLCAFLYADDIPEEIFTGGPSELGPVLQPVANNPIKLDEALGELFKYSLVRRNSDAKMLSIHRLVQAVLKDGMDKAMQRQWAKQVVRAVNQAFPDVDFATWQRCQRCLSHALVCAALIEQWDMKFTEAARLLNAVGHYLWEHALYNQAWPFYKKSLEICQQVWGPNHSATTTIISNIGVLYLKQGLCDQAELLHQQALDIRKRTLGPYHPDVAQSSNNLAAVYRAQGRYPEAEKLYAEALAIVELNLGPEHPEVATILNNLGIVQYKQSKYAQAESNIMRALTMLKKEKGMDHPNVARSLSNLALIYKDQGYHKQAELFYQQSLAIFERTLGPEHPDTAEILVNYATLLRETHRETETAELEARAEAIWEKHAQKNQTQ